MSNISELEPKQVFYWFEQISRIPRGSGNVGQISDFLVDFAKRRNLEYIQDESLNVIIIKEAFKGYETEEPVILQGHMDMVAVKTADTVKDMTREGLELEAADGFLYAKGTSLGGDDGIAVAYMLALLDSEDIPHPRLEAVITVDEEVGMDGARNIDLSMLKSTRLMNIDSEEEGILLAGCAGGARVRCILEGEIQNTEGTVYEISLHGLQGGHSGMEIQKNRANANILLGELLSEISKELPICLYEASGGFADNAISVWAKAVFTVKAEDDCQGDSRKKAAEEICGKITARKLAQWQKTEPEMQIDFTCQGTGAYACVRSQDTVRMGELIKTLPNGVQAMSSDIPDMVETSLNLGKLKVKDGILNCDYSVRSSQDEKKRELVERMESITQKAGGRCEVSGVYPGWAYRADSPLRSKMVSVYEEMYGEPAQVQTIHAGLECGLFMEKIEDLDCVSFGPNILDIHTVHERLDIASAKRVWNYILEILCRKENA